MDPSLHTAVNALLLWRFVCSESSLQNNSRLTKVLCTYFQACQLKLAGLVVDEGYRWWACIRECLFLEDIIALKTILEPFVARVFFSALAGDCPLYSNYEGFLKSITPHSESFRFSGVPLHYRTQQLLSTRMRNFKLFGCEIWCEVPTQACMRNLPWRSDWTWRSIQCEIWWGVRVWCKDRNSLLNPCLFLVCVLEGSALLRSRKTTKLLVTFLASTATTRQTAAPLASRDPSSESQKRCTKHAPTKICRKANHSQSIVVLKGYGSSPCLTLDTKRLVSLKSRHKVRHLHFSEHVLCSSKIHIACFLCQSLSQKLRVWLMNSLLLLGSSFCQTLSSAPTCFTPSTRLRHGMQLWLEYSRLQLQWNHSSQDHDMPAI